MVAVQLDDAGRDLKRRHEDWWRRQGMLHMAGPGQRLGDLWLPLADGTLATSDVTVTLGEKPVDH